MDKTIYVEKLKTFWSTKWKAITIFVLLFAVIVLVNMLFSAQREAQTAQNFYRAMTTQFVSHVNQNGTVTGTIPVAQAPAKIYIQESKNRTDEESRLLRELLEKMNKKEQENSIASVSTVMERFKLPLINNPDGSRTATDENTKAVVKNDSLAVESKHVYTNKFSGMKDGAMKFDFTAMNKNDSVTGGAAWSSMKPESEKKSFLESAVAKVRDGFIIYGAVKVVEFLFGK